MAERMLRDHRKEIEAMLRAGKKQSEIASRFGVTQSGMSRFLTGNKGKKTKPGARQVRECIDRFYSAMEPLIREMLFEAVQRKLGVTE